jgi:hypothetical protein
MGVLDVYSMTLIRQAKGACVKPETRNQCAKNALNMHLAQINDPRLDATANCRTGSKHMTNSDQTDGQAPHNRDGPSAKEDRPWAIRSMPADVINDAVAAAKRQRLTVGEWLAVAIRREIALERKGVPALIEPLEGHLLPPGVVTQATEGAQDGLAWLLSFHELIRRHGELRKDGKPAPGLVAKYGKRLNKLL